LPPILRNIPVIDTVKRWFRRAFIAALVIAAIASLYVLFKSMRNPEAEYVSAAELQGRPQPPAHQSQCHAPEDARRARAGGGRRHRRSRTPPQPTGGSPFEIP
jgi:uncharacterized protein YpbB